MSIDNRNSLTPMRPQSMITHGGGRKSPDPQEPTTGTGSNPRQGNETRQSLSTLNQKPRDQFMRYLDSLKPRLTSNSSLIQRNNTMIFIDDLENTVIIYDRHSKFSLQPPRRDSISSQLWEIEESGLDVDNGIHHQDSSVQLGRPVLSRQSQTLPVEFDEALQELQLQLQQPQKPNEKHSAPTTPESSPPPLQRSHCLERETKPDPVQDGRQVLESDSDKPYMSGLKPQDLELERPMKSGPRPGFLKRAFARLFGCGGVPQEG